MSAGALPAPAIAAAVAAGRAQLRMEGSGEQAALEAMAASAILLGEAFTGTILIARTIEDVLPAAAGWRVLAAAPVRAIAGVTGLPSDGAPFVLAADGYAIDIDAAGCGWVRVTQPGAATRLAVSYQAGLAEVWEDLPASLTQGIAMLIAHLFEDRAGVAQPPAAVAALWRPFRRMRLAAGARA